MRTVRLGRTPTFLNNRIDEPFGMQTLPTCAACAACYVRLSCVLGVVAVWWRVLGLLQGGIPQCRLVTPLRLRNGQVLLILATAQTR